MTNPAPNPNPAPSSRPGVPGPPTKHQLALMIWIAVFPTLTVLNLALGDWLRTLTPVMRLFRLKRATCFSRLRPAGIGGYTTTVYGGVG